MPYYRKTTSQFVEIDFRKNSYAYNAALKNGWISEICSHMKRAAKPAGYWTKDRCIKEARKNETFSQFRKKIVPVLIQSHGEMVG